MLWWDLLIESLFCGFDRKKWRNNPRFKFNFIENHSNFKKVMWLVCQERWRMGKSVNVSAVDGDEIPYSNSSTKVRLVYRFSCRSSDYLAPNHVDQRPDERQNKREKLVQLIPDETEAGHCAACTPLNRRTRSKIKSDTWLIHIWLGFISFVNK